MNKFFFTIIVFFCSSLISINAQKSAKEFSEMKESELENKVFDTDTSQSITKMPEFRGGTVGLFKYLGRKLKYPKSALKDSIVGQVYVKFLIDKNGEVSDVVVTKGLREDIDNEAVRVIQSMPKWTPAQENGENIDVVYSMPIYFTP